MAESRYACRACGTWTCSNCGGSRANTGVDHCNYPCHKCRGRHGVLVPTMHTEKMWRSHNAGDPTQPHEYGDRPPEGDWATGFGPRVVPPIRYRGVVMPDIMMDFDAWRAGVDAALEARE